MKSSLNFLLKDKEKKYFLFFGSINFLITNLVLHALLLISPTFFATILSSLTNVILGYYFYGKRVFNISRLNKYVFKKYILLASFLWIMNFGFIQIFFYFGVNKNIIAILLVPFLVSISFWAQKKYVFN